MPDRSRSFVLVSDANTAGVRALSRLPILQEALREAGAVFEMVFTRGPSDATEIVRDALRLGASGIAVAGGDSVLNDALNGYFDEEKKPIAPHAWLAVLPTDTAGDFRRTLGLSGDIAAMVTRMMWARPKPIDVGWVLYRDSQGRSQQRAFLNVASFGLSGNIERLASSARKWMGAGAAHVLSTLGAAASYRARAVRVGIDDETPRDVTILTFAVANARYFGGGMHVAPRASMTDGAFDVVCIEDASRKQQVALLPHLFRGSLTDRPGVTLHKARRVVAEPADWGGPVLLDVDGEARGALPAVFEIAPSALLLRA